MIEKYNFNSYHDFSSLWNQLIAVSTLIIIYLNGVECELPVFIPFIFKEIFQSLV